MNSISILKALRLSFLALSGLGSLSLPAHAGPDCAASALVKRTDGSYAIVLQNSCSEPVNWSYAACIMGQATDGGYIMVQPNQTFQSDFETSLPGQAQLKTDACIGNCVPALQNCSITAPLNTQNSETKPALLPPEKVFTKKETPAQNGVILKPLDELLAEKPAPAQTPVSPLQVKPAQDGSELKLRPLPQAGNIRPLPALPALKEKPIADIQPASCLTSRFNRREIFARGEIVVENICPEAQVVAARICVPGETDTQAVLSIPGGETRSKSFNLPDGADIRYVLQSCAGENCTPVLPQNCMN